ncbi:MAG TPA: hypothetical protein VJY64_03525 [Candidatus Onthovivens sp.]|nr:hypothetical protein [Candidatus Onthovivens sp.]
MKILKVIASPFIAIWRWIKETAWVQPLLIVGVIFGIIFSIPSITTGIQGLMNKTTDDIAFYKDSWLSMAGSKLDDQTSQVNKFFDSYATAQEKWSSKNRDEARELMKEYSSEDKFFLIFVQEECDACVTLKDGLEYLRDNWDLKINGGLEEGAAKYPEFKFQSIIADETFENDEYYEEEGKKPIDDILVSKSFNVFYEDANQVCSNNNYYFNIEKEDSSKGSTIKNNTKNLLYSDKLQTPTVALIDLTEANKTNYMISSIFYSLEGSDKYAHSDFLADAWTGKNLFSVSGTEK